MPTGTDNPARVSDPAIEPLLRHTATLTNEWVRRQRSRRARPRHRQWRNSITASAADEVTAAWEQAAGRRAEAIPYGDAVAALHTPYDEDTEARDAFLDDAPDSVGRVG